MTGSPSLPAGRLIDIADPDDPRIAAFRNIRERDLRRNGDRLIAEGTVVLRALIRKPLARSDFAVDRLLLLENRVAGLAALLAELDETVSIYRVSRSVMDRIAGFPMHRGVLALVRRTGCPSAAKLIDGLPESALIVVGHAIANHDNIGGLLRNAAVFGADAALFDSRCCDPLYRKAVRVSVGAAFNVPFVHGGAIDTIIASLAAAGFSLVALSPSGRARIEEITPPARIAILVGTEGSGLPETLLRRLETARIAQAPGMDSLNVATASGIALYHLARAMGRV